MTRLSKSDVIDAIGRQANLDGADLSHLHLEGLAFDGLSLKGADLHGADLTNADMRHCDMTGVDLNCANLTGTNLGGACLINAKLVDAYIDTVWGLSIASGVIDAGFDPRGYRFIGVWDEKRGWMVKAGCRWFTMALAEEHWTRKENADALARLGVIKSSARAYPVEGFVDVDDAALRQLERDPF
jgi:hypothetical protein